MARLEEKQLELPISGTKNTAPSNVLVYSYIEEMHEGGEFAFMPTTIAELDSAMAEIAKYGAENGIGTVDHELDEIQKLENSISEEFVREYGNSGYFSEDALDDLQDTQRYLSFDEIYENLESDEGIEEFYRFSYNFILDELKKSDLYKIAKDAVENGYLEVWRAIQVESRDLEEYGLWRNVGRHFSYDREGAEPYRGEGDIDIVFACRLPLDSVNWQMTGVATLWDLKNEMEVVANEGDPVYIMSVEVGYPIEYTTRSGERKVVEKTINKDFSPPVKATV